MYGARVCRRSTKWTASTFFDGHRTEQQPPFPLLREVGVLAQRRHPHHRAEDVVSAEVLSCHAGWEHLGVGGKFKPSPDPGFDQVGLLVAGIGAPP